ncbi:unnamed protein product [Diamesa hyperborea]
MSAWEVKVEENNHQESEEVEKSFEDNFTSHETTDTNKLPDSVDYIKKLESKLNKIKKDPNLLKELTEKREECIRNLLNSSSVLTSDSDLELEYPVNSSEILRHIIPQQALNVGEIAHLINNDHLSEDSPPEDNSSSSNSCER